MLHASAHLSVETGNKHLRSKNVQSIKQNQFKEDETHQTKTIHLLSFFYLKIHAFVLNIDVKVNDFHIWINGGQLR